MRTAGRTAESGILTKNRLSGQNARTACFFCCLLRREQESRRHFQMVFARVVWENLVHLRGEIRRERCRLQASRWCMSGRSFPPARRSEAAKSSPAGKSVSSWVPPRWVVREKGYLVKNTSFLIWAQVRTFLLARHFLVTGGGGFAARAKEKHRFYRIDANLAGKYTHSSNIIKMQNFRVDDFGKYSGCPSSNVKDEYP